MKLISTGAVLLAATVLALPATVLAQTEQQRLNEAMAMQRGIYAQDAAANLDEAIGIYREIAGPRTSDRALAAEAQYRLSQALLQKGDLTGATEAMVQLSTNFPDQAERISRLAGAGGGRGAGGGARAGGPPMVLDLRTGTELQLHEIERSLIELRAAQSESFETIYDREFVPGGTRTITTRVENMSWTNPQSWLRVADGATRWNLLLPAPNMLIRVGMTRVSLPVNEEITVVLTADASGTPLTDGSMLGRVESIVRVSDQSVVFDRAAIVDQ